MTHAYYWMFGFRTGEALRSGTLGLGTGGISMSDVMCPKDAETLDDCEYTAALHTCTHLHDVAVTCSGTLTEAVADSFHHRYR